MNQEKVTLTSSVGNPWLVQRCQIKADPVAGMMVSESLRFEYMGSSEFECGVLPQNSLALFMKKDQLRVHTYTESSLPAGIDNLYFLALPEQAEMYQQVLKKLIEGKLQTKEYVFSSEASDTNVWLDLANQIVISSDFFFLGKFTLLLEASMKKISRNREASQKGDDLMRKELKDFYKVLPGIVAVCPKAIEDCAGTQALQSRTKHDIVFWLNGPRLGAKKNWLCGFYTVEDIKEFITKQTGRVQEAIKQTEKA